MGFNLLVLRQELLNNFILSRVSMGISHTVLIADRDPHAVSIQLLLTPTVLNIGVLEGESAFNHKVGWKEAKGLVLTMLVLVCFAPHFSISSPGVDLHLCKSQGAT